MLCPRVTAVELIGCGGTGAALAELLARMIAGFRLAVTLRIWDGDSVEEANVARQNFFPFEIGANKAEAIAIRLAGQLGIPVAAEKRHWTKPDMQEGQAKLVITAVDSLAARKRIAQTLPCRRLWLDVGNDHHTGQAIFGTTGRSDVLQKTWREWKTAGYCNELPDISACNPRLWTARAVKAAPSCADEPFRVQGFGVNAAAAIAAAGIAAQVLVNGQVKTAQVWIDTAAGRMLPRLITRELFAPWAAGKEEKMP
jgi:PRTRC genetic system ThiF family protein